MTDYIKGEKSNSQIWYDAPELSREEKTDAVQWSIYKFHWIVLDLKPPPPLPAPKVFVQISILKMHQGVLYLRRKK
jgi:hypothetical protein